VYGIRTLAYPPHPSTTTRSSEPKSKPRADRRELARRLEAAVEGLEQEGAAATALGLRRV